MGERAGWLESSVSLRSGERSTKEQVTRGEWVVRSVEELMKKSPDMVPGYGMVDSRDPYYGQLARINFDGSKGLKDPHGGDGTHA